LRNTDSGRDDPALPSSEEEATAIRRNRPMRPPRRRDWAPRTWEARDARSPPARRLPSGVRLRLGWLSFDSLRARLAPVASRRGTLPTCNRPDCQRTSRARPLPPTSPRRIRPVKPPVSGVPTGRVVSTRRSLATGVIVPGRSRTSTTRPVFFTRSSWRPWRPATGVAHGPWIIPHSSWGAAPSPSGSPSGRSRKTGTRLTGAETGPYHIGRFL
jgi:hypothetical protein